MLRGLIIRLIVFDAESTDNDADTTDNDANNTDKDADSIF